MSLPSIYVSHGSPMVLLNNTPARDFLAGFGRELGKPKAILICTAHFETNVPALTTDEKPQMIYDFGGFPRPLFEMVYAAPGSPALAERAAELLAQKGIKAYGVHDRGFDHGTWVPLKLMYPDADVPVVQLAVQPNKDGLHHMKLGEALAPLRDEDVLVIGSGSMTHNLYELSRLGRHMDLPTPDWVKTFGEWAHQAIEEGRRDDIAHWDQRAPFARENHPSPEHFLPLPFAMGAAGPDVRGKRVHSSCEYGVLMMDAYTFD